MKRLHKMKWIEKHLDNSISYEKSFRFGIEHFLRQANSMKPNIRKNMLFTLQFFCCCCCRYFFFLRKLFKAKTLLTK